MAKKLKRRDFLKIAGAAALAVSAAGVLSGCEEEPASSSSRPGSAASSGSTSGAGSNASSSSSSSSSSSAASKPLKILWVISAHGDGTATLEGYDSAGDEPAGEVTLPTKVSGNLITAVSCNLGKKVTKLIVPGNIKKIYRAAMDNTNLREVVLQEGVEELGLFSFNNNCCPFRGCSNLSKVQIPKSLKSIEKFCFADCGKLKSISLPEGLTMIGENAFQGCGLTSVVIPSTVTTLGNEAFYYTDLKEVTIKCGEDGWGGIGGGYETFRGCDKLEKVTMNDKTSYIGYGMFRDCTALKTINLPKKLDSIERTAFQGCTSLQQLTIPQNVTGIGIEAFKGCTSLKKVNLLATVTEIPRYGFQDCEELQQIFIPASVQKVSAGAFDGCVNLSDVYYPLGESAWTSIVIDGNSFFTAANLHTNAVPLAF